MTKDLCPSNSLVWWFIASGLGLFVHSLEVLAFALSKAQGGRFYDGLRCIIMGKPKCVCVCVCEWLAAALADPTSGNTDIVYN